MLSRKGATAVIAISILSSTTVSLPPVINHPIPFISTGLITADDSFRLDIFQEREIASFDDTPLSDPILSKQGREKRGPVDRQAGGAGAEP